MAARVFSGGDRGSFRDALLRRCQSRARAAPEQRDIQGGVYSVQDSLRIRERRPPNPALQASRRRDRVPLRRVRAPPPGILRGLRRGSRVTQALKRSSLKRGCPGPVDLRSRRGGPGFRWHLARRVIGAADPPPPALVRLWGAPRCSPLSACYPRRRAFVTRKSVRFFVVMADGALLCCAVLSASGSRVWGAPWLRKGEGSSPQPLGPRGGRRSAS